MKKIFSSALVLGLALGLNSAVSAQDRDSQNSAPNSAQEKTGRKNREGKMRQGARRRNARNGMMGNLNDLNLTDAQKQQIQNLRQSNRTSDATRSEMRQLSQAQRNGSMTDAQRARLETLREQNRAGAERMRQQVLAILTPEQRERLEQTRSAGGNNKMGDGMPDRNRREARQMGNRGERGNRRAGEGRLEGLNLTDAQREQLRNLRTSNRQDNAVRQEMRELREAKRNGSLTSQQQDRLKALRDQAKTDGSSRQQQILSILTPEQRRQLEQNQTERRGRRGDGQKMRNSPLNRDK